MFFILGSKLRRAGLLRFDSIGRTYAFSSLVNLPACGIAVGFVVCILCGDPHSETHTVLRYAQISIGQFLIIMAALSVSATWLEMVERVRLGFRRPNTTFASNQDLSAPERGVVPYNTRALAAATLLSVASLSVLVAVSNILFVSFLLLAVMPAVGASFIIASNRIYLALIRVAPCDDDVNLELQSSSNIRVEASVLPSGAVVPTATVTPSAQTIAAHVRVTARGIGIRCAAISFLGVLYGLCRPSSSPVFTQQNSLPPWMSGQIAVFLLGITIIGTSTFIATYLDYWVDRRQLYTGSYNS